MTDSTHITIAGRQIGEGRPCFVIAEAGINHNGDTALAGGPEDNLATGAAWVLTRSSGTWSQPGAKLTGAE